MPELRSSGDVVEHQSYLNGTRYYLLEGSGSLLERVWEWTLSFTLPKQEGEAVSEGDVSLVADTAAWFGSISSGSHVEVIDEDLGATTLQVALRIARLPEAENTEVWQTLEALVTVRSDGCELLLTPALR